MEFCSAKCTDSGCRQNVCSSWTPADLIQEEPTLGQDERSTVDLSVDLAVQARVLGPPPAASSKSAVDLLPAVAQQEATLQGDLSAVGSTLSTDIELGIQVVTLNIGSRESNAECGN